MKPEFWLPEGTETKQLPRLAADSTLTPTGCLFCCLATSFAFYD